MPRKTFAGRSRMSEEHAREGDIPAYFAWEDGSEYEVWEGPERGHYTRRYHGPLFGLAHGDWKTETWSDARAER